MVKIFPVLSALLLAASGVVFDAGHLASAAQKGSDAEAPADAFGVQSAFAQRSSESIAHADPAADEKDYVRLRNLALSGDYGRAQRGLIELLAHDDLPVVLRVRVYVTAISIATIFEDWQQAFSLLNEAMPYLSAAPEEAARLLGSAAHLYAAVGEIERAIDLGLRAVRTAEAGAAQLPLCHAIAALSIAYESAEDFEAAQQWRERQVEACTRAGDALFAANGKAGVGKALAMRGLNRQALEWGEASLADYEAHGYEAGAGNARLQVAQSLVALGEQPRRAEALLTELAVRYRVHHPAALSLVEVEKLRAALAESRGDAQAGLAHLKEAMKHSQEAERRARTRQLAYLQIEFDTQLKEREISLLEAEKALAEANAISAHRRQLLLVTGLGGLIASSVLLLLLLHRTLRDRKRYRWGAEHDGLTRLINHQHLRKLGEAAFARATQAASPFTAIAVDIDLFKLINDTHGHAAGDEALRAMGTWIRDVTGDDGIAARRGGDEFMILIDGDAEQAKALVIRLRERIVPVIVHDSVLAFTISAGICQADAQVRSFEQLLHRADKALYRAKRQGRDRLASCNDEATDEADRASTGSLVVVGSGIQFGRHVSERTLSEIQQAQVVFCLVDPFALAMITRLRPDAINLGTHYAPGRDRRETYRDIDAAIMREVRAGKAVCAVFYGHPGVFADVPHQVVHKTRAEGLSARMEPGISAEACLYADLGIDPGQRGVQSLEATHFLCFERQIDPQGLVLLWQVTLAGDWSCTRLEADRDGLKALVEKLMRWYPPDHEVILYEAAQLPIESFRAERLRLSDLPDASYKEFTTLVIPALAAALRRDPEFEPASG
jgi:diguanylate cyclase (GGDEF)-like protein